ncbi:type II toxin-antitoxin system PemK/MazF family toxin [Candidatus Tisiphia endosymbiont of Hybos culiciformis]|uniref:type II toxin-antitoxin system PemK/MazF family toxin n=1 Tax=Candidatus Tisiphia endosymbiont of Hybos culiciformis TaxID=3139331 RepID=UPI003CCAE50A
MELVDINRFDILLVSLDPSQGSEIKKTRPCVVISPNEMNKYIRTVIVVPMTSKIKSYPTRIPIIFEGKEGSIVLDQIRTIDKSRIIRKLGILDSLPVKSLEG